MINANREKVIGTEPVYDKDGKLIGMAKFIVPQEPHFNAMLLGDSRVREERFQNEPDTFRTVRYPQI